MIILNGNEVSGYDGVLVMDLLEKNGYKIKFIAVEYNGSILPKNEYEKTILKDNDKLEVVSFVGGG